MELDTKLEILSAAAKYDVSCSSSGSSRKNTPNGLGNSHKAGICHSWSEDGRCISLLKILFSNRPGKELDGPLVGRLGNFID